MLQLLLIVATLLISGSLIFFNTPADFHPWIGLGIFALAAVLFTTWIGCLAFLDGQAKRLEKAGYNLGLFRKIQYVLVHLLDGVF